MNCLWLSWRWRKFSRDGDVRPGLGSQCVPYGMVVIVLFKIILKWSPEHSNVSETKKKCSAIGLCVVLRLVMVLDDNITICRINLWYFEKHYISFSLNTPGRYLKFTCQNIDVIQEKDIGEIEHVMHNVHDWRILDGYLFINEFIPPPISWSEIRNYYYEKN
jgi:hypothetical protein